MLTLALAVLPAAVAQPPALPRFVAHAAAPAPARGTLVGLSAGWAVALADPPAAVPAGDLVGLRRADRPVPPWPRDPHLVLATGDRVRGTVTGGDARAVRVRPGDGPAEWAVPVAALAAVWVAPPPADAPPDPAAYPWAPGPRRGDAVLLANGDVVRGTVAGFASDPAAVRVKTPDPTPVVLPLDRVAAVAFDPSLARARRPKGPYARAVLADGSRVGLASATSDGASLRGTTLFGAAVDLPVSDLIALDVLQGKAAYLSDLKPTRAAADGFNGLAWPWAADRSAKGLPLRLRGPAGDNTLDKGLGTHPRTTLTYALGGKYRRFEAAVGLDPGTGRRGAAAVKVLVDGRDATPAGVAGGLTAGPARAVAVDVAGANELTLVVDFGPAGDVQADLNWGDARLID